MCCSYYSHLLGDYVDYPLSINTMLVFDDVAHGVISMPFILIATTICVCF